MLKIGAVLFLVVSPFLQGPYSHTELGFSMTLPEGFYFEGDDPLASASVVQCWVKPAALENPGWVRMCVERLDGVLPREKLHSRDIPQRAEEMQFTWKGLDLQGVRAESQRDRQATYLYVALVPLRKAGIRITTEAPRTQGPHAQAALVSTLATLQGETNWLSRDERAGRMGTSVGQIGAVIMALGIGMWLMKRRMEKNR